MKRKGALLMAFVMGLSLFTGCGDKKEDQTGTNKDTQKSNGVFSGELEKNVTIRVLENDTAISRGYFDELIAAFNEEYKEQGITAVDANMDQYLDLANDGPYGYGPDVLYQANDIIMQYAQGRHIYPLPVETMDCYKQIPENAWSAYQTEADGSTYYCGVPVNVQAPMLYYRSDLLPEDWETAWDQDGNKVPDMVENWNNLYAYSVERHKEDSSKYGYMKSLFDVYMLTFLSFFNNMSKLFCIAIFSNCVSKSWLCGF